MTDTIDITEFLELIDSKRILKRNFWMDICNAINNHYKGGNIGLDLLISYTNKTIEKLKVVPDYLISSENIVQIISYEYNNIKEHENFISIKTLAFYAREDNPQGYKDLINKKSVKFFDDSLSTFETDIIKYFNLNYFLDYVYCNKKWFIFKENTWKENESGLYIKNLFSTDFINIYEVKRLELLNQSRDSQDQNLKSQIEIKTKKIYSVIAKLKQVTFKSKLLTELKEHANDADFFKKIDKNTNLFGVSNGILEICENNIYFRCGKPEDFIFTRSRIKYIKHSEDDKNLLALCKWLFQVFPDRELLEHFLKFSASCLRGGNKDKIFTIWTGDGNNSKSMITKLFEQTFGDYCKNLPIEILTERKNNSSSASPELARCANARIAFLAEPEDHIRMNKGTIKRFTGGDSFFARMLNDNGGDIKSNFKLILMCNKVPEIANGDNATKNRTKLIPFLSTWKDEAPEDEETQMKERIFKKDTSFENNIINFTAPFLYLIVDYFNKYCVDGLNTPSLVEKHTEQYWRDNDIYSQFIADTIITTDNIYDKLTIRQIYEKFKDWYRESFPNSKIPSLNDVKPRFIEKFGKINGSSWFGLKFIDDDECGNDLTASLLKSSDVRKSTNPKIIGPVCKKNILL